MFIVQLQITTNLNESIQTSYAFCGGGQGCFQTNKEIEMGRDLRHEGRMCLSEISNDNKNHHDFKHSRTYGKYI